jgi:hypothetical protein
MLSNYVSLPDGDIGEPLSLPRLVRQVVCQPTGTDDNVPSLTGLETAL